MQLFFIILSSLLTIISVIPYLIDIVKGRTKPRLVSWFTWSLLTAIGCAASLAEHQYASAILMFFATLATAAIVILGFKHGDRTFELIDILCQIGALCGLVLWLLFNSPAIAVFAAVIIDFIGAIPTIIHSWKKPYEETWATFALGSLGGVCTLLAVDAFMVTAIVYPAYIAAINFLLTIVIIGRYKYAIKGTPSKLREV